MAVIVTPQEKIDEYFASTALSQSLLKKLSQGIGAYLKAKTAEQSLYYEEKGSFIIGSAVDLILTGESGDFEKKFHVSQITKKPSDVEMSIINRVFDTARQFSENGIKELTDYKKLIENAAISENWYNGKPGDTRINNLITKCSDYFEDLKASVGKQILTTEEDRIIKEIVLNFKTSENTMPLFRRAMYENSTTVDIYYQLPIYFYYKGVYCKALLDLLIVKKDANGNIIELHPYDIKTMAGSTLSFSSSLKTWGYHIQAAWYVEALLSPDSTFNLMTKTVVKKDMIQPFRFVVESTGTPGNPLIYQIDEEILHIGKFGKTDVRVTTPNHPFETLVSRGTKGFEELLDTYIYQEANDWREEKIITDSKGVLKLGWNGIKGF